MRTFRGGSNFICAAANQPNAREMPIHVIYFIRIGIHIQSIRRLLCLHHLVPTDDVLWFRMTWDVLASWKCVVHAFTSNNWHSSCQSNMPHSFEKKCVQTKSNNLFYIFRCQGKVDVRVALVPSQIDWETLEWAGLLIEFIGKFLKLCFYLVFPLHKNGSQWILVQCPERAEEPMSFIRKYLLLLHSI